MAVTGRQEDFRIHYLDSSGLRILLLQIYKQKVKTTWACCQRLFALLAHVFIRIIKCHGSLGFLEQSVSAVLNLICRKLKGTALLVLSS